jgi:hypothetical protein
MANQLGWTVLNPSAFAVVWDGGADVTSIRISGEAPHVTSHFGYGILTINPGFYLETSPEVDVLVKAVPNWPKDGIFPLEGLMETDWFEGSFTYNIRLTRPGLIVGWDTDEPLFQIVPYPRGWIERFQPSMLADGPLHERFFEVADSWEQDRINIMRTLKADGHPQAIYDQQYRRGTRHDGGVAPPTHQLRLPLRAFERRAASDTENAGQ